jgi:hypothetical protein
MTSSVKQTLLECLANVCDANLVKNDTSKPVLVLPERRTQVSNIARFPDAVRKSFPPSLLRYVRGNIERKRLELMAKAEKPEKYELSIRSIVPVAVNNLRIVSARKIRAGIEPTIERLPEKRLFLSQAKHSYRDLVALNILTYCLEGLIVTIEEPPPFYIANFQEVVLTGDFAAGSSGNLFDISLCVRDAEGYLRQGPAVIVPVEALEKQ